MCSFTFKRRRKGDIRLDTVFKKILLLMYYFYNVLYHKCKWTYNFEHDTGDTTEHSYGLMQIVNANL